MTMVISGLKGLIKLPLADRAGMPVYNRQSVLNAFHGRGIILSGIFFISSFAVTVRSNRA